MTEPTEPEETCRPVEIDGEVIRVHGAAEMSEESQAALTEVIRAAKRRLETEQAERGPKQLRALAFNAVAPVLQERGDWLRLTTRRAVADAVLAVVQPELDALAALREVARGYCGTCGRGDAAPTVTDWEQQKQRADQAAATVERVRDLRNAWHRMTLGPGLVRCLLDEITAALDHTQGPAVTYPDAPFPRLHDPAARATAIQATRDRRPAVDEPERAAWVIIARIRDVIDTMDGITGARHWARILRRVIDGQEPPPAAATEATDEWTQQDDGTWTLPINNDGGVITVPASVTSDERARFAAAWSQRSISTREQPDA